MKFAICNEIYQGWPLEKAFAHAAATGYDAIEIAPFTIGSDVTQITSSRRADLRQLAERSGLAIAGIHWVLVQTEGLHLTHPDDGIRRRTSDYLCALVDFCSDLGSASIVVGSPKQRSLEPGVTHQQAWDWATSVFQAPVALAESREVTLCLEPLAPSETNFINAAAEAIAFTSRWNSRHFKIILDVKAMSSEPKPIPDIIRDSFPHFAHFHANDANLKGPGFGETDFRPIAAALKEVGYDGVVSVEVFRFEEGPEAIATGSLEYLQRVFR